MLSIQLDNWIHGKSFIEKVKSPIVGKTSKQIRFELRLTIKFYLPHRISIRSFQISVGDILICNHEVYSGENQNLVFDFDIPTGFNIGEYLYFKIEANETFIPFNEGEGNDQRELLCVLNEMDLVEVKFRNEFKLFNINAGKAASEFIFKKNDLLNITEILDGLYFRLLTVINSKKPFSLIRLGDGEGRIFGYGSLFNQFDISHEVLGYQFGPRVFDALDQSFNSRQLDIPIKILQQHLINSVQNADWIFVPSLIHFNEVTDNNCNALLGQSCSVNTLLKFRPDVIPHAEDHFVFRFFQRYGYFAKILNSVSSVTIISHSDCTAELKKSFGLDAVTHIKIPGHATFMSESEIHFPDAYLEIIRNITVVNSGDLFLVAAGYLGKLYCNVIKQRGGIAIDIGSVFDGWVGVGRLDATEDKSLRLN